MPGAVARNSTWRLLALTGVLAGTLGLAQWVSTRRIAALTIGLKTTLVAKGMVVSLPTDGWVRVQNENASGKPESATELGDEGVVQIREEQTHRTITVELIRPQHLLPPGRFVSEKYRASPLAARESMEIGKFPGAVLGFVIQKQLRDGTISPTSPKIYILTAAVTLPSGRIGSIELSCKGQLTTADRQLFQNVLDTVQFPSEIITKVGDDALERLRYRPMAAPVIQINQGRTGDHGRLGESLVITLSGGDIVVLEAIPVVLPPLGPSKKEGDVSANDAVSENDVAEVFARLSAEQQDPTFAESTAKRVSERRLMLTPEGPQSFSVKGLVLWSDQTPGEAVLLVAKGGVNADPTLTVLLNRAADLITFEKHAEDFNQMVLSGIKLAQDLRSAANGDNLGILWTEGRQQNILGWSKLLPTGSLETRKNATAIESVLRTTHEPRRFRGGQMGVQQSQGVWNGEDFVQVSSRPITMNARPSMTAEAARVNPTLALNQLASYIPTSLFWQAVPRVSEGPVLLLTTAIPWLEMEANPLCWQVLVWPAGHEERSWYIHAIGSGRTLLAKYDANDKLINLQLVGTEVRGEIFTPADAINVRLPTQGGLAP